MGLTSLIYRDLLCRSRKKGQVFTREPLPLFRLHHYRRTQLSNLYENCHKVSQSKPEWRFEEYKTVALKPTLASARDGYSEGKYHFVPRSIQIAISALVRLSLGLNWDSTIIPSSTALRTYLANQLPASTSLVKLLELSKFCVKERNDNLNCFCPVDGISWHK